MTDIPKIEDIVDFSVGYFYCLFSSGDPVEHSQIFIGESKIIEKFSLPDSINSRRLFLPVYHLFLSKYAPNDRFPNCGRNSTGNLHYWSVNGNLPSKEVFKEKILFYYKEYLESNLSKAFQSFS